MPDPLAGDVERGHRHGHAVALGHQAGLAVDGALQNRQVRRPAGDRDQGSGDRQGAYEMREIVNAILYQGRTGCQWDYLPRDLCQALEVPIEPKNVGNIPSKLKASSAAASSPKPNQACSPNPARKPSANP